MNDKLELIKSYIEQGLQVLNQTRFVVRYAVDAEFVEIKDETDFPLVIVYPQRIIRRSIVGDKKVEGFGVWVTVPAPVSTAVSPDEFDEKLFDTTVHPVEAAEFAVLALMGIVVADALKNEGLL